MSYLPARRERMPGTKRSMEQVMAAKADRKGPGMRKADSKNATTEKRRAATRRTAKFDGPNPVDIHVGSRLRMRRTVVGLSQTELAEKVGLTFQAIQKYEHGDIRISASRLYELAIALGVSIAFFFEGLPDSATAGTQEVILPEIEDEEFGGRSSLDLVRTFAAIRDPELRRLFVQILRRAALLPASEEADSAPETVVPIGRSRRDK